MFGTIDHGGRCTEKTAPLPRAVRKAYKVDAQPVGRAWNGIDLFSHGQYIYLMGPDGKFRTLFPPVMDPETMAKAIGRYLG